MHDLIAIRVPSKGAGRDFPARRHFNDGQTLLTDYGQAHSVRRQSHELKVLRIFKNTMLLLARRYVPKPDRPWGEGPMPIALGCRPRDEPPPILGEPH